MIAFGTKMVRVRHCLFLPFPLPFLSFFLSLPLLFLFLLLSFFLWFFLSFCLSFFLSFSVPFPFVFLSFSFLFPFPFLFLSLSFLFLFPLPFLFFPFPSFTIPFPFPSPRSCEFFDQGVKPALGKTTRGEKTIMLEKPFERARGFYNPPRVHNTWSTYCQDFFCTSIRWIFWAKTFDHLLGRT